MKRLALAFTIATACGLAFTAPDVGAQAPPASLVRKAEQGNVEARLELARRHLELAHRYILDYSDKGDNFEKGVELIDRAIEQFETAFNDDSESVKKWLYPIAKQGNAPAQLYLAILFLDDDGGGIAPLAKNRAEGMRWLRRVAAQGELTSHMLLIHEASEGGDDTEVEKLVPELRQNRYVGGICES